MHPPQAKIATSRRPVADPDASCTRLRHVAWRPRYAVLIAGAALAATRCSGEHATGPGASSASLTLVAGGEHTCRIQAGGSAYCWGYNMNGDLGNGDTATLVRIPVAVAGGLSFATLTAAADHTCGVTSSGTAYCWGWNSMGELGTGDTISHATPIPVAAPVPFSTLTAGGSLWSRTCGLTSAGTAYCWGSRSSGQLGVGDSLNVHPIPTLVVGGIAFTELSAQGYFHVCGVARSGAAYCWGYNNLGQLGVGDSTNRSTPVPVAGGLVFKTVAAGGLHTCGLTTDGAAYCWGSNGAGESAGQPIPVKVGGGLTFVSLAVGDYHNCAVTATGAAYCWGGNAWGELGITFDSLKSKLPLPVSGSLSFSSLAAGLYYTCGVASDRATYCWGDNSSGQLGDGTGNSSYQPVRALLP